MKKLLALLLLSPLAFAEYTIHLSCSVDPNANIMQAIYGQRIWIFVDFDKSLFGITSHAQVKERGDILSLARELEISPGFYKAKGRVFKLNRTTLLYGEDNGSEQAYCSKQSKANFSKEINLYLKTFKNKRQI
jgi:hypothetical protein